MLVMVQCSPGQVWQLPTRLCHARFQKQSPGGCWAGDRGASGLGIPSLSVQPEGPRRDHELL